MEVIADDEKDFHSIDNMVYFSCSFSFLLLLNLT